MTRTALSTGLAVTQWKLPNAERIMNKRKFAVRNVTDAASEILEKTHFQLSPEQWEDFVAILDAPAQPDFALARLLNSPAPWGRKQRSKSAYNG